MFDLDARASSGSEPAQPRTDVREARGSRQEAGPTITAILKGGPLKGRRITADVVEGRPPKTLDVPADDGSTCRYCLLQWEQSGPTADYEFLYHV